MVSNIAERVTAIADPLAEKLGFELVDVEYVKEGSQMILRVFIDREGGITLDHCQEMSHALSDELDRVDPIEQSYHLEVSSPGIERPLKKDEDFVRFAGKPVSIKLFAPLEGKKKYGGILRGLEEGEILLEVENNNLVRIPRTQVAKANLAFI